ncbi:MAG TPA: hypothetical protein VNL71_19560 [Chloroflexota bacterium]|nr:hypothetical protein [Chloroflexota bacterium]
MTEIVPTLLLGPITGVMIDRVDRRRLLIGVDGLLAGAGGLGSLLLGRLPLRDRATAR